MRFFTVAFDCTVFSYRVTKSEWKNSNFNVFKKITDLSECQLMQVPDAVYHLMRHTELKRCDLSGNVITKIPPKFAFKFSLITGQFDFFFKLHFS